MSNFFSELEVQCLDDSTNPKWRLNTPLLYSSDIADRVIAVPAGYVTDFASTPRVPFIFEVGGDIATRASVVHDFLYTTHLFDRAKSDNIFIEACDASGVAKWRSRAMWFAIRLFGGSHW